MKPRLLDLFCGAGGASEGYHRAGFEVVGVDIKPQPRYPFTFRQGDAIPILRNIADDGMPPSDYWTFDAIHASPPCQRYSNMTGRWEGRYNSHPDLVGSTRDLLIASRLPYIIENVVGAPLENPIMLCGSSFGLEVRRHRLFECSFPVFGLPCNHTGRALQVNGHPGGSSKRDPDARFGNTEEWRAGMGIDWMTGKELAEAIPPAYTEHIGAQLIWQLQAAEVAP